MKIEYSEFKGNAMMKIVTYEKDGKTEGIMFGKKKWQIILDHLDEIRAFVGVLPEQSDPGF